MLKTTFITITAGLTAGVWAGTNLGSTEVKTVIVEHMYRYDETILDDPVMLTAETVGVAADGPYATPVDAARAVFSSMLGDDFDRWFACWSKRSQAELVDVAFGEPIPPSALAELRSQRTAAWKQFLDRVTIAIVAECKTKRYSQVAFEIRRQGVTVPVGVPGRDRIFNEDGIWRDVVRFVNVGEAGVPDWRETLQHDSHPVAMLWWSDRDRIQVIAEDE